MTLTAAHEAVTRIEAAELAAQEVALQAEAEARATRNAQEREELMQQAVAEGAVIVTEADDTVWARSEAQGGLSVLRRIA